MIDLAPYKFCNNITFFYKTLTRVILMFIDKYYKSYLLVYLKKIQLRNTIFYYEEWVMVNYQNT